MFLRLPYFSPKSFGFFYIWLLVYFRVTPSQLLIEFSFVVSECPVLSVLFYPLSISLYSSFFGQYFLVYFLLLCCYFSPWCLFLLSAYFSSSLSYHSGLFSYFFICVSNRIFIPVLIVSSCFLKGYQYPHKLIFLLHRLVHLTRLYYSSVCKVVCDLFH